MFGILFSDTPPSDFIIDQGHVTWHTHRVGTNEPTRFLIVEAFHSLTEMEQIILQHWKLTQTILAFILGASTCLLLVPVLEIWREF